MEKDILSVTFLFFLFWNKHFHLNYVIYLSAIQKKLPNDGILPSELYRMLLILNHMDFSTLSKGRLTFVLS